MAKAALRMAMAAMVDREANATEVAQRLGIARTTLYLSLSMEMAPQSVGPGAPRAGHWCIALNAVADGLLLSREAYTV